MKVRLIVSVVLTVPFLLRLLVQRFRRRLLKKETALLDLPLLGKARDEKDKISGTVVICGGSIAGLLAARVCHDHFERVIIVEPEAWLTTEDGVKVKSWTQDNKRARVMQYTSVHGNLAPVTDGLFRLFPNFEKECCQSEISLVPADFKISFGGRKFLVPHKELGPSFPLTARAGRQGTETLIRRLTLDKNEYPNIEQIAGTVIGVDADPKNSRYLKTVHVQTEAGVEDIDAILVIDCTGPAKAGPGWIQRAGFGGGSKPLDKLTVSYDARMRYASFRFRLPAEMLSKLPEYEKERSTGGLFIYIADANLAQTYCGAMDAEGEFVTIICGSWGPSELPNNLDEIRECLKSTKSVTPIPEWIWKFFDLCQEVEDTMEVAKVRVPPSCWTHYELASDLPANYVAFGDSVCRVNPVFGQGGSKAMMGAVALNNVLQDLYMNNVNGIRADFSQRVFRNQADKIAPLWDGNKMVDYAYKTTIPEEGETLDKGATIRWYLHKLQAMCDKDEQIGSMFWKTVHSYGTSIDVLNPVFIVKVLLNVLSASISGN
ncbi:hypothetical protein D9758_007741 [Tetrapyrgos nigripes]|uniref:Uncharacterized protein n=1 Tax=Tetrapyrgos nigripes TaxID=182062 RepID=A0A8H5LIM9_9AGAR|nr:hypothetical protein D9758_007741 [Tetrapyrgos nigripes]